MSGLVPRNLLRVQLKQREVAVRMTEYAWMSNAELVEFALRNTATTLEVELAQRLSIAEQFSQEQYGNTREQS